MRATWGALLLLLSGCATTGQGGSAHLLPGSRYVAMGSSYAAGAGIGPQVLDSPRRCGRTVNNYAHLVAANLGLDLIDVSCGGAMTTHLLGPWVELPPQLDAVTPDTRLVTVTIGGNDLNYVRYLATAMCGRMGTGAQANGMVCPPVIWPSEADYQKLEGQMRLIAREVRRRAPGAVLAFVDYLRIIPEAATCASVSLDESQLVQARRAFDTMADVTSRVAASEGAILVPAGHLSKAHDACSEDPWAVGFPGKPAAWHPTASGHAAIAEALVARLK